MPKFPQLTLPEAAQLAHSELIARELAPAHSVVSVVFLKGPDAGSGHYDVRIEPPAVLSEGGRLRGFCIALDGAIRPATDFRTAPGASLSTPPPGGPPEKGLRPSERQG